MERNTNIIKSIFTISFTEVGKDAMLNGLKTLSRQYHDQYHSKNAYKVIPILYLMPTKPFR